MYETYYKTLLPKCGKENLELLFLDTDSFCFGVKNEKCFNKAMFKIMDYSNYPTNHKLFDNSNQAQLGYFKDELKGESVCTEFVGLRSKCYAMNLVKIGSNSIKEKKVCKGLGKVAIQKRLKLEEYKKCLFDGQDFRHHYTGINSQKHNLYTVVKNKTALSNFDSKRHIYHCGIHSSPFGSDLVRKYGNVCYKCERN
jgi:hypothetical protein